MNQWNDWERERYYREENQARQQRVFDQAQKNRIAFLQSRSGQQASGALGFFFLAALPFVALHAAVDRYSWAGIIFAMVALVITFYYGRSFMRTDLGRKVYQFLALIAKWLLYAMGGVALVALVIIMWNITDS
jgi:hypothetical protein